MGARRTAVLTKTESNSNRETASALSTQHSALGAGRNGDALSSEYTLRERAQMLMNRMSTTAAASVVGYREELGDYGDMSEHNQEEWLFVSRNAADARELREVEGAIQRLKDGVYGICLRCEQPISPKRLHAVPWARFCIACQENRDN